MVGEWSDEAFFYVEFNEPPPAPVIVAPSYGTIISCADEGPLVLDWQAVEDESGIIAYELELSVPGSGSDVITSSGDETEIELPEFCIPGTWSWQVRAIDGTYVEGEWSDYMEFEVVEEQPEPGLPDLVIASVSQIGDLQGSENGPVEVPVEVVVINQGSGTAESQFKIEINYSSESGSGLAPFTVEGQGFWYPFIEGLAPGEFASVSGIVTLPDDVQGYWTTVWAIADSCSGDEFMPSYCRVEEGNEENNGGGSIDIEIPVYID
jgi:hypothetical protein